MYDIVNKNKIENIIYEIRGKQVMLDSDLAKLYQCKNGTKSINLAVKRHINRFPERYMFQLTRKEYLDILRFQSETLELESGKYSKYQPYAFTEQGVAMLSAVLKTDIAEQISIQIMDAFVSMRKYISHNLSEQQYYNSTLLRHDNEIKLLQQSFEKLEEKKVKNEIYFYGQIYDAYSKLLDLMIEAKKELIIIDNYADKTVLDMVRRLKVEVLLITKENSLISKSDIDKYNKQYDNLKIKYDHTFHDRYLIIDKKIVYHLGASINHAGSKTFSVNKIEEDVVINSLITKINNS